MTTSTQSNSFTINDKTPDLSIGIIGSFIDRLT